MAGPNIVKMEKDKFLPSTGKMILILTSLFSVVTRVVAVIVLFTPALGHLSLLHHYQHEKIGFRPANNSEVGYTGPYVMGGTYTSPNNTANPWDEIERGNWTWNNETETWRREPPPLTIYTGLKLVHVYTIFSIMLALHIILVFFWKRHVSPHFR